MTGWAEAIALNDDKAFLSLNGLWTGKKPPFVTATVVRNTNFTRLGILDLHNVAVLEVEARQLAKRELKCGDIIVERSGGGPKQPVGRVVRFDLDEPGYSFSNFTSVIRVIDQERFDPAFVFRVLQYFYESGATDALQRRTTGLRNLDFTAYRELVQIPLISIQEQRQISRVLATVQAAIEYQQAIITTTRELKRGMMDTLFTQGLRGEPQKPTEIGLVPKSWCVKRIGEIATLRSGGTPSRKNEAFWAGGTIPWVKTGEVNYCVINDTEEMITEVGLAGSSAKIFPAGTLLMAMYGQGITRGKVGILGIDAATNQACVAFFPKNKDEVLTAFLFQLFTFKYEYIRNLGHGANQKNLSADIVKTIQIAFPAEIGEQDEIVSALSVLDDKLAIAERKQNYYTDLFKTLLKQLMTAKTMVHELDLDALSLSVLE